MNVSICAKVFDVSGVLEFAATNTGVSFTNPRRVNRSATLDGGSAFNDGGYSQSDRSLEITYKTESLDQDETARRLLSLHSRVTVSINEGVFEAVPESFDSGADENTFNFFIVDKLNED